MIGVKLYVYVDSDLRQIELVKSVVKDKAAENENVNEAVRDEYILSVYDGRPDYTKGTYGLLITDDLFLLSEFSAHEGLSTMYIGDRSEISENEVAKIDHILSDDFPKPVIYKVIRHVIDGIVSDYKAWLYEYLLQTLIDSSPDMVWIKDEIGRHVVLNDAFGRVVGKTVEECINKEHPDIWGISWEEYESSDFACRKSEEAIIATGKMGTFEELVLTGGEMKQFTTYKTPLYDKSGKVLGTCGIGHDVTNFSNMGIELSMLIENIPFPMAVLSADYKTMRMNASLKELTDIHSPERFNYRDWKSSNLKPVGDPVQSEDKRSTKQEFSYIKDDRNYSFNVLEQVTTDFLGNVSGHFCLLQDITYQRIYENTIITAANTDVLTGLYNRRYFYDYLEKNISSTLTLLYMDLDNFKKINDTYSHARGDDILKRTANHIKDIFPEAVVARLGGDEYAAVIEGGINQAALEIKCKRLEKAVRTLCRPGGPYVTISIGVASTDGSKDVDELINEGDSLMYEIKKEHHEIMENDPATYESGNR